MRQKFKQWTHDLNQESVSCFALSNHYITINQSTDRQFTSLWTWLYTKPNLHVHVSVTLSIHMPTCACLAKQTKTSLTRYCWFGSSAWSRWINLPMSTCSSAKSSGSSGSAGWSLWSCTRTFTMFKMLSTFNDMCTGIIQEIQNKKMNWLCHVITFNAYMHASVKLIQCFFFWLFTHTDVCIVAYVLKI